MSTGDPGSSSEGGSSSSEGSGSASTSESEGSGSSSTGPSECTPADECVSDDDCPLEGSTCIACLCIGGEGCVSFGDGEFGDCLTDGVAACMDDEAICLVDSASEPQLGACASPCEDVCDCPVPPKGFEDQLACDVLTLDGGSNCFITCAGGLPCPDGWTCLADFVCMVGEITELDPYGDCANLEGDCPDGDVGGPLCVAFLEGEVCTIVGCDDPTDCPDAPPTGTATVACIDLTGEAGGDCYLDCSGGEACPDGMDCHADFGVCYWPPA